MSCEALKAKHDFVTNSCTKEGVTSTGKHSGLRIRFTLAENSKICRLDLECLKTELKHQKEIADFVFYYEPTEDTCSYHIVELKTPANFQKAFSQIVSTIKLLSLDNSTSKEKISGYIVSNKSLPGAKEILRDLKDKFRQKHGKQLQKLNSEQEIKL